MKMKPKSLAVKGALAAATVAMLSACAGNQCTPDQAVATGDQAAPAADAAPEAAAAPATTPDTYTAPAAGGAPLASPAVPPPDYNAPPPADSMSGPVVNMAPDVSLPDQAVTAKVKSALAGHNTTRGLHIQVSTSGGVVKLTGTVPSSVQMDQAVSVIDEVEGVKEVNNLLRVAR